MGIQIRKALASDLDAVAAIYDRVHDAQDSGQLTTGWIRGVYPTEDTARQALKRGDLFVQEDGGEIVGAAIINQTQVDAYYGGPWQYAAEDNEVMVLHTLVIDPAAKEQGCGQAFVKFYEDYARRSGSLCLRMDTNAKNENARRFYKKLGYSEVGIVPCVFNGIDGVNLVLLEKKL